MEQERRTVRFDHSLGIEAYRFEGIMQKFPKHFHEYYVLGFLESGRRRLLCQNTEHFTAAGDVLLFNPEDSHACEQVDDDAMDYRCLNIPADVFEKIAADVAGRVCRPRFTSPVIRDSEAAYHLHELHRLIMAGRAGLEKEEILYFLIEHLISACTEPGLTARPAASRKIQSVCEYMESHFAEVIALDELSRIAGLNKYTLLRTFTRQLGLAPHQYLQTIRIGRAKKMLEAGSQPLETALATGFADQSHFTKFFKNLIGLTPRRYRDIFREDESAGAC